MQSTTDYTIPTAEVIHDIDDNAIAVPYATVVVTEAATTVDNIFEPRESSVRDLHQRGIVSRLPSVTMRLPVYEVRGIFKETVVYIRDKWYFVHEIDIPFSIRHVTFVEWLHSLIDKTPGCLRSTGQYIMVKWPDLTYTVETKPRNKRFPDVR